jgi:hypothetical protein
MQLNLTHLTLSFISQHFAVVFSIQPLFHMQPFDNHGNMTAKTLFSHSSLSLGLLCENNIFAQCPISAKILFSRSHFVCKQTITESQASTDYLSCLKSKKPWKVKILVKTIKTNLNKYSNFYVFRFHNVFSIAERMFFHFKDLDQSPSIIYNWYIACHQIAWRKR